MRIPSVRSQLVLASAFAPWLMAFASTDPRLAAARREPAPRPFFDARFGPDGRPKVQPVNARTPAARRERADALERLAREVPGVRVDAHALFGTPHWVASTVALLTRAPRAPIQSIRIAQDFVLAHPALFEVGASELADARVSRDFATRHNGARHFTLQQTLAGIDVFDCVLRGSVTSKGELINLSSTLLPNLEARVREVEPVLGALDALRAAAVDLCIDLALDPEPLGPPEGASRRQEWSLGSGLCGDALVTTELVWFPLSRDEIHAAWSLVLPEAGGGNTYDVVVDALDGALLWRTDRRKDFGGTQDLTFRVYTSDSPAPGSPGSPTPNQLQFPFVARQLLTIPPAQVAPFSPNHWIDDNVNETLGNNVDASVDLNGDSQPDLPRPQGNPFRVFDFPLDLAQPPSAYREAAVTQAFVVVNRAHDRLYALGFDEVAANFQTTNFGLGGVGNDPMRVLVQPNMIANAAFFNVGGSDGTVASMLIGIWTGPTPDRDGALEADILYHEYAHGLSTRLLERFIQTEAARGLGEGWSDFFAVCLSAEPGDDFQGTYPIGPYTAFQLASAAYLDNYYFGHRRFPYATDLNKNPLTFADIDPTQYAYPPSVPRNPVNSGTGGEVHETGEVWCNTLLEARANFALTHGFAANELVMQLVVDGLKLSPPEPNFVQARDAILQADLINHGGANLLRLWQAFAKRGLGASATSPPSGPTTVGVVEAFDLPVLIFFQYPDGTPERLDPFQPATFRVNLLAPAFDQPIPNSGRLHYSIDGGPFVAVALAPTAANQYVATLPAGICPNVFRYYVSTDSTAGLRFDPPGAPAETYRATVYTSHAPLFADDFETDTGWTSAILGATAGQWERAIPLPTGPIAQPRFDSDGSGQCWLTQNAASAGDVDGGSVVLSSPLFDLSGSLAAPSIRYDYWCYTAGNFDAALDFLKVEISSSGAAGPWIELASYPDETFIRQWRHEEVDVEDLLSLGVALTPAMMVRFTASDAGPDTTVECAIDAFRVTYGACDATGAQFCFGDGTGSPCPCGNLGQAGEGCAHSFGRGALLTSSGVPSVSADTFALTCTGMPGAALAVYFQGATDLNALRGIAAGDGLLCVGGTVIRIGRKTSVGGASTYPQPGDALISVKGLITAGATRYYQTQYRNAATFCTPATFNYSNGTTAVWVP